MVGYRCYILDAEEHIVQAHDLDCESDAQAKSAAEDFLGLDPYHRIAEVWKATRRVAKLERQATQHVRLERRLQRPGQRVGSPV